ncbi:substrate-binding periplasmic protein [Chitiniphilus eburneus]|uniref:Amino acid ABC transporter substrate-binding protein n=1 Tax=Chitiniphilus eburneus TaxID=2571148 RepID=A0A4U0PGT5_9NEIS|nr:transporter substrate-binding domain-containing protein [Chitiniphilus eburneus]TJZ67153.1 amino acid ABC transporter substrate-binding protein [Chitiniphilus eburneus]
MKTARYCLLCCLLWWALPAFAQQKVFVCGLNDNFQPYQYRDAAGQAAGLDAEVARLVFARIGRPLVFRMGNFEELYSAMYFGLGLTHGMCGGELTPDRLRRVLGTQPYFWRRSMIFVRADGPIRKTRDLHGRIMVGDADSYAEHALGDQLSRIRVRRGVPQDIGFELLRQGKVEAVIAPEHVGAFLAKRSGVAVRELDLGDPGTPVGFLLPKGESAQRNAIDRALLLLKAEGRIAEVVRRYNLDESLPDDAAVKP